jgi:hypothetical protein
LLQRLLQNDPLVMFCLQGILRCPALHGTTQPIDKPQLYPKSTYLRVQALKCSPVCLTSKTETSGEDLFSMLCLFPLDERLRPPAMRSLRDCRIKQSFSVRQVEISPDLEGRAHYRASCGSKTTDLTNHLDRITKRIRHQPTIGLQSLRKKRTSA